MRIRTSRAPPEPTLGVDPHREVSKARLSFASLVYKAKVSVTNFLFKALIERALGRVATRGLLAFTAIPINALWNVATCWFVLREARICVMGPSAALEMTDVICEAGPSTSPALVAALHQALGAAVVSTTELHPNHVALMRALRARVGEPAPGVVLDESSAFLSSLAALAPEERRVALRALGAAAILDGRLVRAEKQLLERAYAVSGLEPALEHVEKLRRAFVAGDPIPKSELLAVA